MAYGWYAATVYPFKDLIAEADLRRRGLQPFNPKVRTARIVRGRRLIVEQPYIPGYIFINFDIENERWKQINSARGVQRLICSTPEMPSRIRPDAMKVILDRCVDGVVDQSELDAALAKFVPVGSTVKVTKGPFEGREGKVVWSHNDRVKVLLSIFQRPTEARLRTTEVSISD
jgi:transcription antitermination factor NusG